MSAHERERLAAWIDDELPPGERAAVEAHVAECEECAALLADLEAVDGFARDLPLEVPAGYFESFPARVRSRIETLRPRRGAARASWRSPAWTWAAAAALLLGVVTPLTIARLGRDGAPEATRRVGAPAEDALADVEARRPAASAATSQERREAAPERTGEGAEEVAAPSTPRAETPARAQALGEMKKELRQDSGDAEEAASKSRRSGAESFAAAPAAKGSAGGAALPTRDVVRSPPLRAADARSEEGTFEAGVVSVDEALPEAEVPRPQAVGPAPRGSAAEPPRAGIHPPRAPGPSARNRQSLEADTGGAPEDARAFSRLTGDQPVGAAAWRERRGAWVRFIEEHPDSPHIDDARVQVVEAGIMAWRADGDPADLARAREDAEAYLARDDARQKERVRGDLERIRER